MKYIRSRTVYLFLLYRLTNTEIGMLYVYSNSPGSLFRCGWGKRGRASLNNVGKFRLMTRMQRHFRRKRTALWAASIRRLWIRAMSATSSCKQYKEPIRWLSSPRETPPGTIAIWKICSGTNRSFGICWTCTWSSRISSTWIKSEKTTSNK